jgi:hypothetical protein
MAGKDEAQAVTVKATVKTSVGSRRELLDAAAVGWVQAVEDMASIRVE